MKEMTISHFEKYPNEINLEEVEFVKATTSDQKLNSTQNNNPLNKILQPLEGQTVTSIDSEYAHISAEVLY
jgi:hypothetical protein